MSVLNAGGTGLLWSTYLGSSGAGAVARDSSGNLYVAGGVDITHSSGDLGIVKIAPEGNPMQFPWQSVTNGASFNPGLPAPGGLATIFLPGLDVTGTMVASGSPLPTTLAGVSILVGGTPAPILAVAPQQVNFQVPFEATAFTNIVEVRYQGLSTYVIPQVVAPGIFTFADGSGVIEHSSDYSLVTPANPAKKGEVIIVYATGLGLVSPPVPTGMPATGPAQVQIGCGGGVPSVVVGSGAYAAHEDVLYAGLTPGYVGLYQLNVQLSPSTPSGEQDLAMYAGSCNLWPPIAVYPFDSNTVTLPVQ